MAATLTPDQELTYVSFPIEKTETTADGNVIVYGKATDGSVDSDEQIVDTDFSAKAISDWLATGANVRVQHNAQRDPAGVGIETNVGAEGETWVKSLVVEPVAKALVNCGALRAYSVGIARPKIVRDAVARGGRIVDGEIVEISLVDRPANKNCGIQLVKAAGEDGHAEFTGKAFGEHELITKGLGAPSAPASTAFSPADLAKLLKHREVAEQRVTGGDTVDVYPLMNADPLVVKRDVDPNVGGGVDRDKIPAEDFAGRDRSFPIVKPGDVQDAAASIGRAGPDNYTSDELRQRITSIAERKGPQFVAQLPESWTSPASKAEKPFGGNAAKPFGSETDETADEDSETDEEKGLKPLPSQKPVPSVSGKGAKDCPECGTSYDADAKKRRCTECNAKLPLATKRKKIKCMCAGCGANIDVAHRFCPECGNEMAMAEPDTTKGHDFTCLMCGRGLEDDEKYCPGCGKENPGYEGMNTKGKPSPGDSVPGSGTQPVPAHREPDGATVEAFEHDAGLPTAPDSETKALTRLKSVGAPTDLGALHDLTCAAYHPDVADKCYPNNGISAIDLDWWQKSAFDAATGATLEEALKMTQLWQHATTLKGTDPEVVADVRHASYKAFQDANPGPGNFPQPTELTPTRFRRPVITAGHAQLSQGYDGPNTHSVPSGGISASQFSDGYQTAGRAAESPSNKASANEVIGYPTTPGQPTRVHYQEAQRNAATSAMAAMHDHISQSFPGICPLDLPGINGQPPEGARPVPAAKSAAPAAELQEPRGKKSKHANKSAGGGQVAELMTLMRDMQTNFNQKLEEITTELQTTRAHAAELQKSVDALGDLPDPATAPFKGVAQPSSNKNMGLPAGANSVADTVERTQLMMMRELETMFRTSPDPAQREAAWTSLVKMRGLGG